MLLISWKFIAIIDRSVRSTRIEAYVYLHMWVSFQASLAHVLPQVHNRGYRIQNQTTGIFKKDVLL